MKPLGTKVLVKMKPLKKEQTAGTLVIELEKSSGSYSDVTEGTVTAIGNDVDNGMISVGDKIFYETHGGFKVNIDGEEIVIVDIKNILVVV